MNHVRLFLTLALALTLTLAVEAETEWSSHTRATLGAVPSLSLETLTRPSRELVNQVLASFPATEEEAETYATVLANRKAIEAALGESSPVEDTRGAQQMLADCPKLTPRTPPSTIGELKPVDVVAVGAIGDSYTTASNALSTTWLNLKWFPGLSWAMGADAGVMSVHNMFKAVGNANVVGGSVGTGDNPGNMHCNQAVGGAVVQDMIDQANNLVLAFRAELNETVYNSGWKSVNLFIGGNNACKVCDSYSTNSPTVYEAGLRAALEILATLPRTLVSVVPILDGTQLREYTGPFCKIALGVVCPCFTTSDSAKIATTQKAVEDYNAAMASVVQEFNAKTGSEWAAVIQPFQTNTVIPPGDAGKALLSTADCFHLNGAGQALFATGLWNNLVTPIGSKATSISPSDPVVCPTDSSFLYNPKGSY